MNTQRFSIIGLLLLIVLSTGALADIIPINMTANNAPAPFTTFFSAGGNMNLCWKVFDNDDTTPSLAGNQCQLFNNGTGYLGIDLGQSYTMNNFTVYSQYTLASGVGTNQYAIQGSTDNSTWTTLYLNTTSDAWTTKSTWAINGTYRYMRITNMTSGNDHILQTLSFGVNAVGTGTNFTVSVNDTRNNVLIAGFTWAYNTTNASDNSPKTGYCSTTICSITNFTGILNLSVTNVSGGLYQNPYDSPKNNYSYTYTGNISYTFNAIGNTLLVRVFDEATGNSIPYNITVIVSSSVTSVMNYTNNASQTQFANLAVNNYTLSLSGGGYNPRSYAIIVNANTSQTINAYLTNQNTTTIFILKDSSTAAILPGALLSMYRIINGTNTLVESHISDITGQAQFSYTANIQYLINVTLSGYQQKTFILNPILYSSYTILLDVSTGGTPSSDYSAVIATIDPQVFFGNQTNVVNITLQSPEGKLSSYGATILYPGGSSTQNGTNPYGESFQYTFNITTTNILDTINVSYSYVTTTGNARSFSRVYGITSPYINGTIFNNNGNTYGLGWFERVLVSTIIVIFAAGTATILAGELFGLAMGLFIMGFMLKINFMPYTGAVIAIIIGVIVLSRRSQS